MKNPASALRKLMRMGNYFELACSSLSLKFTLYPSHGTQRALSLEFFESHVSRSN